MDDGPVHWLPPWSWGPPRERVGFETACGIRLVARGQSPATRWPEDGKTPAYVAGQLAIMNGEVTCPACRAALTVRALESSDG